MQYNGVLRESFQILMIILIFSGKGGVLLQQC